MSREVYVLVDGCLITKSIDGVTTEEYSRISQAKRNSPFSGYGSDVMGGVNGVFNHADGKRYDSKSEYHRAVRNKGCRVVGNDWNKGSGWKPPIERGVRGDFNVRPQLKQAIEKVMGC
jgi:hypothetical protein